MAGVWARLPGAREISAVCTHLEERRRGRARVLVSRLAQEDPVLLLHVNASHTPALDAYTGLDDAATVSERGAAAPLHVRPLDPERFCPRHPKSASREDV